MRDIQGELKESGSLVLAHKHIYFTCTRTCEYFMTIIGIEPHFEDVQKLFCHQLHVMYLVCFLILQLWGFTVMKNKA